MNDLSSYFFGSYSKFKLMLGRRGYLFCATGLRLGGAFELSLGFFFSDYDRRSNLIG